MKAIQISHCGGPNELKLVELPIPTPKTNQALIRLKTIGINFIDIYMRTGRYPHALPFVPGLEAYGIVEAIGDEVTEVKVGDRVAYTSKIGSYAEYNVVDSNQLIPIPSSLSDEQAAAFPLQGITAQYLVNEIYSIKPGTTVLVHAAAGGVGLLLVQWLKHLGAMIIGTVSTEEKAKLAKKAGVDHIILYTQQDFVAETQKLTDGKGVDYIIDGVGKTTFTKDLDAVRKRGTICIYGAASGAAEPLAPNSLQTKSITLCGGSLFNYIESREALLSRANTVIKGIEEKWLHLKIDHVYPLAEAAKVHEMLENRQTTGKIILTNV